MIVNDSDKPSLDELAHYGVKGMKWGTRRGITDVHLNKVNKITTRLDKVADGTATRRQKIGTALYTPIPQLVTSGLKGSAKENSEFLKGHASRVANGEKNARDFLMLYGSVSLTDLAKASRRKK